MFFMKKRVVLSSMFLASIALLLSVGTALASVPHIFFYHRTDSNIVGGKSNYDNTRFERAYIDITDTDPALEGVTLTIRTGSYSYGTWDGLQDNQPEGNIANADHTFDAKYSDYHTAHVPVNTNGEELVFWGEADSGFSARAFSYNLGGVEVNGVLPEFRTTSEQLATGVPYIEYILNSKNYITGLNIRFINPANPSQPLVKSAAIDVNFVNRVSFWDKDGAYFGIARQDMNIPEGEEIKYQVTYDDPIDPNQVYGGEVRFGNYTVPYEESGIYALYRWNFYNARDIQPGDNNGSGGGCDTGVGVFAVFAMLAAVAAWKKHVVEI
jgi:hypothetical protein